MFSIGTTKTNTRRNERGFTIVELIVATCVFVIAVGTLLAFLARNERARAVTYDVLEARQNARCALEFIISDLRMAGSGIPTGVVTSTASGDSTIFYPITPDTVNGHPEKITILGAMSGIETTLRESMPNASSELKVESTDGFEIGDLVVVTNGAFANLFEVTQVQPSALKIQHNPTSPYNQPGGHRPWPPGGYPPGSRLVKINLITYYVDRSDTLCPKLMRVDGTHDPRVISEYVEELTFNYELQDHTVVTMPLDPMLIRRVIVTISTGSRGLVGTHLVRMTSAARPRCM